ncbi:DsbE family thiol:disulfide interchange protein [Stakelama tenebrarum]|uniref:DsbE family thiol:disulfide interchange protein n=1 Tax=Stakelama tenebrarum TaxID=2711215 RepID=A0A6G6Y8B1_9SPHN|nr:DsbE family thiol:disulfide interchange protein [Sphingosinithalassobacter tenebrarum]QIG80948.1 DsbE family thiol:disulfide interchange protein [Sphingosinithalassobacter tenebrarum]
MRRLLIWLPLAAFLLLLGVAIRGIVSPGERAVRSALIGQPVPLLKIDPLFEGRPGIDSDALATGEPILLNLFASWCVPCIAEAPQLMKLKEEGVPIYGVAVRDTPEEMRRFLNENGDPYTAIGDDRTSQVSIALGASGVPETYVIDGQGRIVKQHIGYIGSQDMDELRKALEAAE